jgi:hypothetical protein
LCEAFFVGNSRPKGEISVNIVARASSNRAQHVDKETPPVKTSRIVALFCAGIAAASNAYAQSDANAQWRVAETTFFDLIQNGYSIVAVTSVAARSTGLPEDTYVLQKNNSVFRCIETRAAETSATRASSPLRCAELVKPYRN